jgi:hypothetical protein
VNVHQNTACHIPEDNNLYKETFVYSIFCSLFGKWAFGEALRYDDAEKVGLEVTL